MQNIVQKRRYQEQIQKLTDAHQRDLRYVFDFTQEDILANQRGEFTPEQLKTLKRRAVKRAVGFIVGAFAIAGLILFVFALVEIDFSEFQIFLWICLGIPTLLSLFFSYNARKEVIKLNTAHPVPIVGVAQKREYVRRIRNTREIVYELLIDKYQLPITQRQYKKIGEGNVYRVFCVNDSKNIASVEVLELSEFAKRG